MSHVTSIRLSKGYSSLYVVEMGFFGLVFKIGFAMIFGLVLETIPLQQGLKGLDLRMEEEQGWDMTMWTRNCTTRTETMESSLFCTRSYTHF
jgi:hypothetical protein